jgi:Ax21 family sulfation-dependent quorum factor
MSRFPYFAVRSPTGVTKTKPKKGFSMKRSLLALALVAVLPFAAQADDKLSYSYVEADYVNVDGDADGFGVRGSFEFADTGFYGLGGWRSVEIDGTNVDIDNWELGFGYAHDLSANLDLISELAYENVEVEGFDADGFRASIGLRGSFSPNFEGLAKIGYADGDNVDGDFVGTLGAQYKFGQTWGLVGEVDFADGGEMYTVGLRASF